MAIKPCFLDTESVDQRLTFMKRFVLFTICLVSAIVVLSACFASQFAILVRTEHQTNAFDLNPDDNDPSTITVESNKSKPSYEALLYQRLYVERKGNPVRDSAVMSVLASPNIQRNPVSGEKPSFVTNRNVVLCTRTWICFLNRYRHCLYSHTHRCYFFVSCYIVLIVNAGPANGTNKAFNQSSEFSLVNLSDEFGSIFRLI